MSAHYTITDGLIHEVLKMSQNISGPPQPSSITISMMKINVTNSCHMAAYVDNDVAAYADADMASYVDDYVAAYINGDVATFLAH